MIESIFMGGGAENANFGQESYILPGSYEFVVPANVFSLSAVCVSYAGLDTGGGLSWRTFPVAPSQLLSVEVGSKNYPSSRIVDASTGEVLLATNGRLGGPSVNAAYGGGNGGNGTSYHNGSSVNYGGGAAGGYTANAPNAAAGETSAVSAAGSGGSPSSAAVKKPSSGQTRYPGGGVGILGSGTSGAASIANSAGKNGSVNLVTGQIGYGAGGATEAVSNGRTRLGAIRIIWGPGRAYPDTNTLDM